MSHTPDISQLRISAYFHIDPGMVAFEHFILGTVQVLANYGIEVCDRCDINPSPGKAKHVIHNRGRFDP